MKKLQLFSIHSIVDDFLYRKNVKINWFKFRSKIENISYEDVIDGFAELNHLERFLFELRIDELFTETECDQIKKYLKTVHNTDSVIENVYLPLKTTKEVKIIYPYIDLSHPDNTINLSIEELYCLPFDVLGHYNLNYCFPSQELPVEIKDDGIAFLRHSLELIDSKSPPDDKELKSIVEIIYQKYDYYVNYNPYKNLSFSYSSWK